jgi:hypothetical protein
VTTCEIRWGKFQSTTFIAAPDLRFYGHPVVAREAVGLSFWHTFREQTGRKFGYWGHIAKAFFDPGAENEAPEPSSPTKSPQPPPTAPEPEKAEVPPAGAIEIVHRDLDFEFVLNGQAITKQTGKTSLQNLALGQHQIDIITRGECVDTIQCELSKSCLAVAIYLMQPGIKNYKSYKQAAPERESLT